MKNFTNYIKSSLIALFSTLLLFSCYQEPNIGISKDITIAEVQDKFYSSISSEKNARSSSQIGINWDLGVYKDIQLGDALAFPIDNAKNLYVSGSETSQRFSVESTSFAFAYKVDDEVYLELVQPVPTNNDLLFTGFVTISDWNGLVKRIFEYEKGVFIGEVTNDNSENSTGRLSGVECNTTYYWDCTEVSVEGYGSYTTCEEVGSSTTCKLTGSSTPTRPVDYIDAGPSGGGGTGGTTGADENLCTNPFDSSLYVPCNENTCGDGYIFKPDIGCVSLNLNMDDQGYKELTSCEKALLKANAAVGFTLQSNVDLAHTKTQEIFGVYNVPAGNGLNDCADAFRHAYFNALNTLSWSDSYAKEWGDAHECETPLDLALEKNMDLFNNAVGRSVATQAPNISNQALVDLILLELEVGHLHFLSPLNTTNNIISGVTQEVVATNCL